MAEKNISSNEQKTKEEIYADEVYEASVKARQQLDAGDLDGIIETLKPYLVDECIIPTPYFMSAMAYLKKENYKEAFELGVKGLQYINQSPVGVFASKNTVTHINRLVEVSADILGEQTDVEAVVNNAIIDLQAELLLPLTVDIDKNNPQTPQLEYGPKACKDQHTLKLRRISANSTIATMLRLDGLAMSNDAAKVGKNLLFAGTDNWRQPFEKKFANYVKAVYKKHTPEVAAKMIDNSINCLSMCLTSSPIELFNHRHIYEKYESLRPLQMSYLLDSLKDVADLVTGTDIKGTIPAGVIRILKVSSMMMAYQLKDYYGIDVIESYKPTRVELSVVEDLYEEFKAYADYTPGEEAEFVDYYLETLEMDDMVRYVNENDFKVSE